MVEPCSYVLHLQYKAPLLCRSTDAILNTMLVVLDLIMPRCALCVCLSVYVDCYSCSRINIVQVRVSIGFYILFVGL